MRQAEVEVGCYTAAVVRVWPLYLRRTRLKENGNSPWAFYARSRLREGILLFAQRNAGVVTRH